METENQCFQPDKQRLGSSTGRSVCGQIEQPSPNILQLETRSRSPGNRCFFDQMGGSDSICLSPVLSNSEGISQGDERQNIHNNSDPLMAHEDSVSNATEHDNRLSHIITTNEGPSYVIGRSISPTDTGRNTQTSGMESIRGEAKARGLSNDASNLLVESWRKGTQSSYNTCWKYWNSWCGERNVDPIQASVECVANFLTELYNKGYAYSSINSYRSAISAYHVGTSGVPIGQHKVVCRIMSGIFNKRPPQPKYTCTWDVDVVLKYLNSQEENKNLSIA